MRGASSPHCYSRAFISQTADSLAFWMLEGCESARDNVVVVVSRPSSWFGGTQESKKQSVKFDLPLSDSVRGKSTLDGFILVLIQMTAAATTDGDDRRRKTKTAIDRPTGRPTDRLTGRPTDRLDAVSKCVCVCVWRGVCVCVCVCVCAWVGVRVRG